jgi:hypothetical protein
MPWEDFWKLLRAGVDVFSTKSLGLETKQRPAAHILSVTGGVQDGMAE